MDNFGKIEKIIVVDNGAPSYTSGDDKNTFVRDNCRETISAKNFLFYL